MNIYTIVELIKLSEQRGVELLIDALIVGIEMGRRNIENQTQIQKIVELLTLLKRKIDLNIYSPFLRDEIFDRVLNKKEKLEDILYGIQLEFQRQSKIKQQNNICEICSQPVNSQMEKFNAQCNHQFHQQCVTPLLTHVMENQNSFRCPLCGHTTLQQDLENKIKDNITFKKSCCPTPQCGKRFSYVGQEIYRCTDCGKRYCLKCQSQSHAINQQNHTVKAVKFEMGDNYKECPKCKLWVKQMNAERILNCQQCKYKFCFGCGDRDGACSCNKVNGAFYNSYMWIKKKIIG
ncbi:unnamed protein product (macronuclear) [Paramecium tetraurelia]|uniref:RING-type domain-containing protein n=1 Tax=Paramecium tetraurelia TaxID=5888 RepID=A0BHV9_PARTE|nr:uncharacterized protein GSPATT00029162001 [Paramecium tetraurelia]CAK58126.1 unnamed protein product [Paramecium tetraurelia]|eukprot:XP_001425524.1 hypothetical protein (macronuclear) [Paramecium tetraurelia strain d4-2]